MSEKTNEPNEESQKWPLNGYGRVTAQGQDAMTVAEQMKELKRFAAQAGYDLVGEYIEGDVVEPDADAA